MAAMRPKKKVSDPARTPGGSNSGSGSKSVKVVKNKPGLAGNKNMVENYRVEDAKSGFTAKDEARYREARMVKGKTVKINSAPSKSPDDAKAKNAKALKAANKAKPVAKAKAKIKSRVRGGALGGGGINISEVR